MSRSIRKHGLHHKKRGSRRPSGLGDDPRPRCASCRDHIHAGGHGDVCAESPADGTENAALASLSLSSAKEFLQQRSRIAESGMPEKTLKIEMQFEREFVAAGGLLMAGCDPTGYGGVLPGFGDQRNIELLVEAGFKPVEAIQIATLNGAKFLGKDASIGSIAPGKAADLVILGANPAEKIENIEKVETVFKDGAGYNSAALIHSVSNLVGLR